MFARRKVLYIASLVLVLPALLINLGLLAFIDDEGIRSLVALEMDLSENYIVPTLHGEFYYNKPPLFNWILLVFFKLAGVFNEWVARLPTVFALLGYGATVYYFIRKHYSRKMAFLVAFVLITCGRILFWDSMLGLIDITFSWVMFTLFMVIFHFFEDKRLLALFLVSYLLTAIGFMLKGLPALVFQATTLLVYFTYRKSFKQLISFAHVAGVLLLVVLLGTYYYAYHQYNDLGVVLETLYSESAKRTVVEYGWGETVIHLFVFPFEMLYHFLPWSLMIAFFIRKDILKVILGDRFQAFLVITFLANILVYWTSPEVYPRYLLMHAPLLFGSFLFLFQLHKEENTFAFKLTDRLFFTMSVLGSALAFSAFFLEQAHVWPLWWLKAILLCVSLSGLTYLYWKWRDERLLVFVVVLLVFRVGFDWFVLPDRNANDRGNLSRVSSLEVGAKFSEERMVIYRDTEMEITNSFYLTRSRGSIIPIELNTFDSNTRAVIDPQLYPDLDYQLVDSFFVRHGRRYYHVGILDTD